MQNQCQYDVGKYSFAMSISIKLSQEISMPIIAQYVMNLNKIAKVWPQFS